MQKPDWLAYFYSHIPCGMWRSLTLHIQNYYNFYSHIPCGMWPRRSRIGCIGKAFLLTHPVWDVTFSLTPSSFLSGISTHTSRVGCDLRIIQKDHVTQISTHTSRVGCDTLIINNVERNTISTHTSRVGCDYNILENTGEKIYFYSHIPCGMWRLCRRSSTKSSKFLLTHPVWDVTAIYSILQPQHPHISRDGLIIHLELY